MCAGAHACLYNIIKTILYIIEHIREIIIYQNFLRLVLFLVLEVNVLSIYDEGIQST